MIHFDTIEGFPDSRQHPTLFVYPAFRRGFINGSSPVMNWKGVNNSLGSPLNVVIHYLVGFKQHLVPAPGGPPRAVNISQTC